MVERKNICGVSFIPVSRVDSVSEETEVTSKASFNRQTSGYRGLGGGHRPPCGCAKDGKQTKTVEAADQIAGSDAVLCDRRKTKPRKVHTKKNNTAQVTQPPII